MNLRSSQLANIYRVGSDRKIGEDRTARSWTLVIPQCIMKFEIIHNERVRETRDRSGDAMWDGDSQELGTLLRMCRDSSLSCMFKRNLTRNLNGVVCEVG